MVLGSFLPWWCQGDFVLVCTTGISLSSLFLPLNIHIAAYLRTLDFFFNGYSSLNNIGLVVVFLGLFTLWFAIYPPKFIRWPKILAALSSFVLVLFTIHQFIQHFAQRIEHLGAPILVTLEDGFVMVLLGSLFLLTATLRDIRLKGVPTILIRVMASIIILLPFSFMLERFYYLFIN